MNEEKEELYSSLDQNLDSALSSVERDLDDLAEARKTIEMIQERTQDLQEHERKAFYDSISEIIPDLEATSSIEDYTQVAEYTLSAFQEPVQQSLISIIMEIYDQLDKTVAADVESDISNIVINSYSENPSKARQRYLEIQSQIENLEEAPQNFLRYKIDDNPTLITNIDKTFELLEYIKQQNVEIKEIFKELDQCNWATDDVLSLKEDPDIYDQDVDSDSILPKISKIDSVLSEFSTLDVWLAMRL